MFYVFEKHFKLFEGQQCLSGLDLWNNININPINNEIIYQLIKKLYDNLKWKQAELYKKNAAPPVWKDLCSLHLAATVYSKHIYFSAALFKNANRCNYTRLVYQQLLPVFWRRRAEEETYFKAFAVGRSLTQITSFPPRRCNYKTILWKTTPVPRPPLTHKHTHTYTPIHICICVQTNTHTHIHTCIHVQTNTHTHTYFLQQF